MRRLRSSTMRGSSRRRYVRNRKHWGLQDLLWWELQHEQQTSRWPTRVAVSSRMTVSKSAHCVLTKSPVPQEAVEIQAHCELENTTEPRVAPTKEMAARPKATV